MILLGIWLVCMYLSFHLGVKLGTQRTIELFLENANREEREMFIEVKKRIVDE